MEFHELIPEEEMPYHVEPPGPIYYEAMAWARENGLWIPENGTEEWQIFWQFFCDFAFANMNNTKRGKKKEDMAEVLLRSVLGKMHRKAGYPAPVSGRIEK